MKYRIIIVINKYKYVKIVKVIFMIKVLFVCHGNICRSPMVEFLFKDLVEKRKLDKLFYIESCATSSEEIGNPVHYGTKRILNNLGIDCSKKRARRFTASDYNKFDYIICMDQNNIRNLKYFIENDKDNKVHLLLEYVGMNRNIRDPWYTGNFNETYDDVIMGLDGLLSFIMDNQK